MPMPMAILQQLWLSHSWLASNGCWNPRQRLWKSVDGNRLRRQRKRQHYRHWLQSNAAGINSTAIGYSANSQGGNSTALGLSAKSSGSNSTALAPELGNTTNATALGEDSTGPLTAAIGREQRPLSGTQRHSDHWRKQATSGQLHLAPSAPHQPTTPLQLALTPRPTPISLLLLAPMRQLVVWPRSLLVPDPMPAILAPLPRASIPLHLEKMPLLLASTTGNTIPQRLPHSIASGLNSSAFDPTRRRVVIRSVLAKAPKPLARFHRIRPLCKSTSRSDDCYRRWKPFQQTPPLRLVSFQGQ